MTVSTLRAVISNQIGFLREPDKYPCRSATRICDTCSGIQRADFDYVLVATDQNAFDSDLIERHARLIVGARGVYKEPAESMVKA